MANFMLLLTYPVAITILVIVIKMILFTTRVKMVQNQHEWYIIRYKTSYFGKWKLWAQYPLDRYMEAENAYKKCITEHRRPEPKEKILYKNY